MTSDVQVLFSFFLTQRINLLFRKLPQKQFVEACNVELTSLLASKSASKISPDWVEVESVSLAGSSDFLTNFPRNPRPAVDFFLFVLPERFLYLLRCLLTCRFDRTAFDFLGFQLKKTELPSKKMLVRKPIDFLAVP